MLGGPPGRGGGGVNCSSESPVECTPGRQLWLLYFPTTNKQLFQTYRGLVCYNVTQLRCHTLLASYSHYIWLLVVNLLYAS